MLSLVLGTVAFILFFVYDINSFTRKSVLLHSFFTVGAVLLTVASVLDMLHAVKSGAFAGAADILLLLLGCAALACTVYSLFFALPFEETYVKDTEPHGVYDRGVYALCRHPGVLFYFIMQLFFGLAALPDTIIINGMIFSAYNVLYAWFQDRVTFPKTFSNYAEYRQHVPFLVPVPGSVAAAIKTLRKSKSGEDEQ